MCPVSAPASCPERSIEFGGLTIHYDERVLTPRPWTQKQSEWASDLMRIAPSGPILELCAGVGHIGLLAIVDNDRQLVAIERNPVACEFNAKNAAAAGLADRVEIRCGRIEDSLADERFAVIIADPPWVRSSDVARFQDDPPNAIDGGPDGMDVAWVCLGSIIQHLAPGGQALIQLGNAGQADNVTDYLNRHRETRLRVTEIRQEPGRGVVLRLDREA